MSTNFFQTLIGKLFGEKTSEDRSVPECKDELLALGMADEEFPSTNPMPIPYNLRILAIADTHMTLREEALEKALNEHPIDVCILLGDIYGTEIETILRLIPEGIPICGVLGNHDGWTLLDFYEIPCLEEQVVEVQGVRIVGLNGSLRYKNTDSPMYMDKESVEVVSKLPAADLFISHDSPKFLHNRHDMAHSGLLGVGHYCLSNQIPLNIHGHHHRNVTKVLPNGTTSICCHGICYIETGKRKTFPAH